MRKSVLIPGCLVLLVLSASTAIGQKLPTASRAGDLQLGGGFTMGFPDYTQSRFKGYMFYGDFDFKAHLGVEVEYHQVNDPDSSARQGIYERTYEVGARYNRTFGNFKPYLKGMIGRGVFNFPLPNGVPDSTPHPNLAYNMYGFGGGVDYAVRDWLNIRADYEYQIWPTFPPNGLKPSVVSIGAAYHFH